VPELPEVETVRRDLQRSAVGLTIQSVRARRTDVLCKTRRCDLIESVEGRRIEEVDRHGKNLIVRLSGGPTLIVNLGMTGQLYLADGEGRLPKHTHVILGLSDGRRLVFRDVRRFGHLELVPNGETGESFSLARVGVDAVSRRFTARRLAEMLEGRTALLKSALLNQSLVAGLGNIYVCEALHRAGLSPELRCHELSEEQTARLHRAIKEVLREAIKGQGTTISDYVTGAGVPGEFQRRLRVYGREGEACRCRGCEHTIERVVQSNRSTFYCPGCQAR
jgi:formamidopyrimidine-DNA glycosylase